MKWNGMEWHGMAWNGMAWHGMEWNGMAWYGMVWYGMAGGRSTWLDAGSSSGSVRRLLLPDKLSSQWN